MDNKTNTKKGKLYIKLSKLKRRILVHNKAIRLFVAGGLVLFILITAFLAKNYLKEAGVTKYTNALYEFVFARSGEVKSFEGRTNILVLGKGGTGHEAPDLTDTIMFVSVPDDGGDIVIISLPRDIWISELRAKLNSIYYWGNQKQENGGLLLAKATVEEIVGLPVHYGVVVDFEAFKGAIDVVGGIDVVIDNGFTDHMYPIPGRENDNCEGDIQLRCRYETITFEPGLTHMDGETSLKFVRSRHAEGEEGTDTARSRRQQKVIMALRDKLISAEVVASPVKIKELIGIAENNVETDFSQEEAAAVARFAYVAKENIHSEVIDETLLENPEPSEDYDNLYVFVPRSGDWSEIHDWVSNLLNN